jgi:hypothetical protein
MPVGSTAKRLRICHFRQYVLSALCSQNEAVVVQDIESQWFTTLTICHFPTQGCKSVANTRQIAEGNIRASDEILLA